MKTKKILSVLLALVMTLSLGAVAFADDNYNWERVPISPAGLAHGDVWFDFTALCDANATEEEKAAVLARFNAGDWYADFDAAMVKVENADAELNGIYSRTQQPYICCAREVGVSFVNVHKNLAGIQVGDYYIDEAAWYACAVPEFTSYYAAQYSAQHGGQAPSSDILQQLAVQCKDIADMYYNQNTFDYNPGGNLYRYQINGMAFPYGRYLVDYSIGQLNMILVHALDVSIRQATAATVAASPWVRVASAIEDAEEGGYYIDFADTAALMAAMNLSQPPTEEEMSMIRSGEWYADFSRNVVSGKITETVDGEEYTFWYPESADLFALLKVKPAAETETPEEPTQSESPIRRIMKSIAAFFLRVVEFIKKVFGK